MGDMADTFNELKKYKRNSRRVRVRAAERETARALAEGIGGDWKYHTAYHWQTTLGGDILDYWPTSSKFRWRSVTRHGDVDTFIRKEQKKIDRLKDE